jgi:hypothetical protein
MRIAADLSRILLSAALVACALGTARGQSAPAPGAWTERDPPRGWVIVRTADFEVQAEIAEPRARRLAQFLQGLRSEFEALWPPSGKTGRQVVKVFASEEGRAKWSSAHSFGLERRPLGSPPSCARLEPFTGDILAFDSGRLLDVVTGVQPVRLESDQVIKMLHADAQQVYPLLDAAAADFAPDLARDCAREAFRQYHLATSPERSVPFWLEESVGNWLGAATNGGKPWNLREPDTTEIRKPQPGPVNLSRLMEVRRALAESQVLPAGDLLARATKDRETEPPGLLAQGWALVHVLMSSSDPARRRIIPALLSSYRASDDGWVPMDAILTGLDTAALDRDWRTWVADQPVDDPLQELARLFGYGLRTTDLVAPDWIKECYSWQRRHVQPAPPAPEGPR